MRIRDHISHLWGVALFVAVLTSSANASAEAPLKLISRGDGNAHYAIDMLKLALSKTGKEYELSIREEGWSAERLHTSTMEGTIDVMWAATDAKIEQDLEPIRVPLYKGLFGYRLLLVRNDDTHSFSRVREFNDLKAFVFGQGRGWPDTAILLANGLTVEQVTKYEGLFHMLDGARFDAFPRGIHEPWAELTARPDLDITVEPTLLLRYVMPYYLFVTPTRPQLAEDIRTGFEVALNDGSFDQLFLDNETVQTVLARGDIALRRVFYLENPTLPPETPLDDKRLWFESEATEPPGSSSTTKN